MRPRALLEACVSHEPLLGLARSVVLSHAVMVLMYHEVLPDGEDLNAWAAVRQRDFAQQMEYVRQRFRAVSLDEAIALVRDRHNGQGCVAVTFDDGYAGNLTAALPVLEAFGIPATVYIATAAVEQSSLYWYDEVVLALQERRPVTLDLRDRGLAVYALPGSQAGERHWTEIQKVLTDLKRIDHARRLAIVRDVVGDVPRGGSTPLRPLTPAEVRTLAQSSLITVGAHTHCHNRLCQLTPAAAEASIVRSQSLIHEWTGTRPHHFSYPNGDYTPQVIDSLRRCGFVSAVTVEHRPWRPADSPYTIPRIGVGRHDTFSRFKSIASGILI